MGPIQKWDDDIKIAVEEIVCYFACNWQAFVNTWKNLSILWKEGSS